MIDKRKSHDEMYEDLFKKASDIYFELEKDYHHSAIKIMLGMIEVFMDNDLCISKMSERAKKEKEDFEKTIFGKEAGF